jgi:diadenosine tetraphosphate (Ap4A) HIT family hydrolase
MSIFQTIQKERIIYQGNYFFLIYDIYPVSPGHILIISKDLKKDFFELTIDEKNELPLMITMAKQLIEKENKPTGFNIGMNCGESAGQTVFHFHCHVIPRYNGDMTNPRGGVRHCIEGKGYY